MSETTATEQQHDTHEGHHPGPAEYVKVAVILAIVTGLEIGAYYVEIFTGVPDSVLAASLLVMMVVKFALVALWFMHLRFDSVLYRRLFIAGIVLAMSIYFVVLLTFGLLIGR